MTTGSEIEPEEPQPKANGATSLPAIRRGLLLFGVVALLAGAAFWFNGSSPANDAEQEFDGIKFVRVMPGSVLVGSPSTDAERGDEEWPQRELTISHGFWLGKYEVTQAQWQAVMGNNPSSFSGANHPVDGVSWEDAQAFITKLNSRAGGALYRLPTEEEWEYAARAGSSTPYPWGEKVSHNNANYGTNDCCDGLAEGVDRWVNTAPVGSFPPNGWGLHDMAGNVWEWTASAWSYGDGTPAEVVSGQDTPRVLRGGAWVNGPKDLRTAGRIYNAPTQQDFLLGFRLVRQMD